MLVFFNAPIFLFGHWQSDPSASKAPGTHPANVDEIINKMANRHVGYIEKSAITLILANYKLGFNWGISARLAGFN